MIILFIFRKNPCFTMKILPRIFASLFFFLFFSCAETKQVPVSDDQLKANLKKHISALASDAFEGRETGTHGEQLASDYILAQFKSIGLKPMGEKKFVQEF